MSTQEDSSRSGARKPANQQRNTAGSRDGTSQQARRGGKANQDLVKPQDISGTAHNGPASPNPRDNQPPGTTFDVDEITKLLESGMDPNAEVYKPVKPATKSNSPANPWASKPGQMANGKDFFFELRKQITEKMLERSHEDKAKGKEVAALAKGG